MELETISRSSTNGRWGITVVVPSGVSLDTPQEGKLVSLGKVERHDTFRFLPDPGSGKWFMLGGDFDPIAGCKVVMKLDLQSWRSATLIVGGPFFAYKAHGYKRRGHTVVAYRDGQRVEVPAAVLAAMGVIPVEEKEVDVETPPLTSSLRDALIKAGLSS